ncbi:hypothetical protein EMCRGX_G013577 [Ephydatia muelleri]
MLRKTLKMKVYRRPLVQALLPGDIDKRVKWAEDYLEAAERDFTYPDYILLTDEAIFHLGGHVKRHNAVIFWLAGLIKDHIIGPFFINGSVTGQVYLQLQQQRVWPAPQAIMGEEEEFVVYQHDGASAHYETHVRACLFYGRGGLVLAMGAMRVVVAAARVAAGKVVVGALVPILVPVVGLVQVAAVLLLLLLEVGAALLLAVGTALLGRGSAAAAAGGGQ